MNSSLDVMGELLDALLDISNLDRGSITPKKKDFAVLLRRIVENFVANAIRYTKSGRIDILCESRGGIARIEVKDTGIGIPAESQRTIFEEYFQLDNPVRDRRKGLGLGLSIAEHIARLLDHRLDVSSTLGKGSTFAVEVPLGESSMVEENPGPFETFATRVRAPVVLFVDDDPAIVDATTMLLKLEDIRVYSALDGDHALAHIERGVQPDVVVSDYRLPRYNGVELIRRVRQATVDSLPAILMTGDTLAQEIERATLSNCTLLHKPVDTERLILMIKNAPV